MHHLQSTLSTLPQLSPYILGHQRVQNSFYQGEKDNVLTCFKTVYMLV